MNDGSSKEFNTWVGSMKQATQFVLMMGIDMSVVSLTLVSFMSVINVLDMNEIYMLLALIPTAITLIVVYAKFQKTLGMKLMGYKLSSDTKELSFRNLLGHYTLWLLLFPVFVLQTGIIESGFAHERMSKIFLVKR
ncbi:RDD family protein (plasmid) [Rossellomorea sp. AcN35-11]|nr:RDD family protein [Rossellomorea aquimaris]WJV32425.1 RDD family protein [Rossellomorea sp. AcN35-11]